jgi:hypothetical protein
MDNAIAGEQKIKARRRVAQGEEDASHHSA